MKTPRERAWSIVVGDQAAGVRVQSKRLDTLLESPISKPDVIKIDAEGAEIEVLAGGQPCALEERALRPLEEDGWRAQLRWRCASAEQRWTVQLPANIESTPAVWDGGIYVGTRDGYFYAVGDR